MCYEEIEVALPEMDCGKTLKGRKKPMKENIQSCENVFS